LPAEDDEFDVLATLVEAYEDWHFPVNDPDPIEAAECRRGPQWAKPCLGGHRKGIGKMNGG